MILAVTLAVALAQAGAPPERTVTKASVFLVQQPSFLAPRASAEPIFRGEKVHLEGEDGGSWLKVSARQRGKKVVGYLHASYVSDTRAAFQLEQKELEGRSTVSGHYNLAVGGFREEVARKRQAEGKEVKRGYDLIERYMPLQIEDKPGRRLPATARARLLPPDMGGMRRFMEEGQMRRQERGAKASPEDGKGGAAGEGEEGIEVLDASATGGAR